MLEATEPRWRDGARARGRRYEVQVEPSPLPPVAGDATELREALTNLLGNALEAMPEGGRVTLRTWLEGEQVCCAVADTGVGMSPEVRRRAFDPFFTTKGDQGSGLGLSVTCAIVARHGGQIEIWSEPRCGTTVTLRLPLWREPPSGLLGQARTTEGAVTPPHGVGRDAGDSAPPALDPVPRTAAPPLPGPAPGGHYPTPR